MELNFLFLFLLMTGKVYAEANPKKVQKQKTQVQSTNTQSKVPNTQKETETKKNVHDKTDIDLDAERLDGEKRAPDISAITSKNSQTDYNFLDGPKDFQDNIKKSVKRISP